MPSLADVAGLAADLLVAAGAEGFVAVAGEDDHADVGVVAGEREGVDQLGQGRGRKALRTSGRLMVTLAMPSAVS